MIGRMSVSSSGPRSTTAGTTQALVRRAMRAAAGRTRAPARRRSRRDAASRLGDVDEHGEHLAAAERLEDRGAAAVVADDLHAELRARTLHQIVHSGVAERLGDGVDRVAVGGERGRADVPVAEVHGRDDDAAAGLRRLVQSRPTGRSEARCRTSSGVIAGKWMKSIDVLAEVAEGAPAATESTNLASLLCSTCARFAFSALRWRGKMTQ